MTFTTAAGMTRESTTATALNFPSHMGTQDNPHLYSNGDGSCITLGCISVVGEPTIATIDGKPYLFFVYALLRDYDGGAFGDVNMKVGIIEKK